jgi:hypothetical protein
MGQANEPFEKASAPPIEWKREETAAVFYGSPRRLPGIDWPAETYVATDPLFAKPRSVTFAFRANDQGWGNTGFSYVAIQVVNENDEVQFGTRITTLTHETVDFKTKYAGNDEIRQYLERGSRIRLVSVSAPWGGYESRIHSASIVVDMPTVHRLSWFLLWRKRRHDRCSRGMPQCSYIAADASAGSSSSLEVKSVNALTFLFEVCDSFLFSKVVLFLF